MQDCCPITLLEIEKGLSDSNYLGLTKEEVMQELRLCGVEMLVLRLLEQGFISVDEKLWFYIFLKYCNASIISSSVLRNEG